MQRETQDRLATRPCFWKSLVDLVDVGSPLDGGPRSASHQSAAGVTISSGLACDR